MRKPHTAQRKTVVPENSSLVRNLKTDDKVEPSGVEAALRHGHVSPIGGAAVATPTAECLL